MITSKAAIDDHRKSDYREQPGKPFEQEAR